ncbi:MAG: prefoldin subunit alpha [Halobacteriales archaeon]
MSAGGDQARLQQMAAQKEELDQVIEVLQAQVERMRAEQREIEEAIEAIESLDSGDEVQVPLGGGAYVRAAIEDLDEIIVELGAGYAAEREESEAIAVLEGKVDRLDEQIDEAQEAITDLEAQGEELSAQAQQEYAELAARQQQGGGGLDLGGNG